MGLAYRKRIKKIKEIVMRRDGLECCYCQRQLSISNVTMEHIVPESKHGTFNVNNLTVSCAYCNNKRGNKSFLEYCKSYNLPLSKIEKYQKIHSNYLKIKVLNFSKEKYLKSDYAAPLDLIVKSCKDLNIKEIDVCFYEALLNNEFIFKDIYSHRKIKFYFDKIIRIIESDI